MCELLAKARLGGGGGGGVVLSWPVGSNIKSAPLI